MVVIAAILKAIKGKENQMEKVLQEYMPKTKKEAGTLAYIAYRAVDDSTKFFVYEKYEDEVAYEAHSSTTYFKEYAKNLTHLLDGKPDIGKYREIHT